MKARRPPLWVPLTCSQLLLALADIDSVTGASMVDERASSIEWIVSEKVIDTGACSRV